MDFWALPAFFAAFAEILGVMLTVRSLGEIDFFSSAPLYIPLANRLSSSRYCVTHGVIISLTVRFRYKGGYYWSLRQFILASLRIRPPTFIMSGRGKGGKVEVKSRSRKSRVGIQFPVGRIHRRLRKGQYAERLGVGAPVYLAAVMEYLAAEVL